MTGEDGEIREGLLDGYPVGEMEVSKGDIEHGGSNPSLGADGEGRDPKEASLEQGYTVSWCGQREMKNET